MYFYLNTPAFKNHSFIANFNAIISDNKIVTIFYCNMLFSINCDFISGDN
ncbi:hypothetical protein EC990848_5231 [Escherichia coli 99.0848]|nr:hypothetical protein EC990848_5231 [Escherichia coli 99.0848]